MNTKSVVILTTIGILAAFVAIAGIAAELPTLKAYAYTFNNQQNLQGAFNFNNQQFKSNFQCEAFAYSCSP